jgi:spore coat protein U-like protein
MEGIEVMKKQIGRLVAGATMAAVVAGVASYSQQRTEAATASANVAVSASVAANCLVSAGTLAFGAYDPLAANDTADLDATGSFDIRCTKGVTAQVGLGNGANWDGSTRRMVVGSEYLNYALYRNAARDQVWDDSGNRYSYTAANKSAQTLTIYGRVPGGQDPGVGNFADTVAAVAEF